MLQEFKVPEKDAVRVRGDDLKNVVTAVFEKLNVPHEDAELGADVLVTADLRGVDSHGVSNMLRGYINGYNEGRINPTPELRIVRESPSAANMDCDRGLGVMVAPKAMEMAIAKAKQTGVGMVTMGNSGHVGMASYHAMMALEHDMIGYCLTAPGAQVLPTFGAEPRLGTNPIAYAVPTKEEPPYVLDIATSVVAHNKIIIARRLGSELPGGYVADMDGRPIMENGPVPEQFQALPLGSIRELGSHKGYGLAMMVEIFCGILSGSGFAAQAGAVRGRTRHFVAAFNVDSFTPVDEFKEMMDDFLRTLKATKPAPGHDRVLVPGQPEHEAFQDRSVNGIPLHRDVVQWLRDTASEMSIPFTL